MLIVFIIIGDNLLHADDANDAGFVKRYKPLF